MMDTSPSWNSRCAANPDCDSDDDDDDDNEDVVEGCRCEFASWLFSVW